MQSARIVLIKARRNSIAVTSSLNAPASDNFDFKRAFTCQQADQIGLAAIGAGKSRCRFQRGPFQGYDARSSQHVAGDGAGDGAALVRGHRG